MDAPPGAAQSAVFYPDLMPGMPPSALMLTAEAVTQWPPLIDIDAPTNFVAWNARISGQFK